MTTEQERKRARLAVLLTEHDHGDLSSTVAERLLATGQVDVTLPPEPEWKPGQYVMLRVLRWMPDCSPVLARRAPSHTWSLMNQDTRFTDTEVTDVEPVAVLTAEDARELISTVGRAGIGRYFVTLHEFFAERGLSTDD